MVDYDFTASIDEDLDAIARGERQKDQWLSRFYFGETEDRDVPAITAEAGTADDALLGLKRLVEENLDEIDAAEINTFPLGNDESGELIVVKPGRIRPVREARRRHRRVARQPSTGRTRRRDGDRVAQRTEG